MEKRPAKEALAELFNIAAEKAKRGQKAEARLLFQRLCIFDQGNENAWVWRAYLAETPEEGITAIQQVLRINPHNTQALAWLKRISPSVLKSRNPMCPFCAGPQVKGANTCSQCNALLSLEHFDRFHLVQNINEDAVRAGLARMKGEPPDDPYTAACLMAIGHLNLLESHAALGYLEEAERLKPFDANVALCVRRLRERPAILVVDDSATVRNVVSRTLERAKRRCIQAPGPMEALGALDRNRVDVILLDVNMPVMDGHQFCKRIRVQSETKNIPVVMLSGNDGFLDKVRGRMSGAVAYLTKPVLSATLLQAIQKQLERRSAIAGSGRFDSTGSTTVGAGLAPKSAVRIG